MADLSFSDDYGGSLFTGGGLHDRLIQEGNSELILTITAVRRETFPDTKNPEWVLSFGMHEDELRLKKVPGRLLRDVFGDGGHLWVGKQIGLSTEWKEWQSNEGKPMQGYTIKVRAIPLNTYAATTGKDQPRDGHLERDLSDEIPF